MLIIKFIDLRQHLVHEIDHFDKPNYLIDKERETSSSYDRTFFFQCGISVACGKAHIDELQITRTDKRLDWDINLSKAGLSNTAAAHEKKILIPDTGEVSGEAVDAAIVAIDIWKEPLAVTRYQSLKLNQIRFFSAPVNLSGDKWGPVATRREKKGGGDGKKGARINRLSGVATEPLRVSLSEARDLYIYPKLNPDEIYFNSQMRTPRACFKKRTKKKKKWMP